MAARERPAMSGFAAVIFDFGGVITESPFEAFNRLEKARGLPRDLVRQINADEPHRNAWARLERAEIARDEFDIAFAAEAAALGHELRGHDVIACLTTTVRPAMAMALNALHDAGLKLGCITNNFNAQEQEGHALGIPVEPDEAPMLEQVMALFDHVIESAKAGIRKPDPRIYAMMCEALGVEPARCVYLDDLGINCKPAAAMGMTAIKVTGEAQALRELAALTGVALAPPEEAA
jgi:putative hydrolase of the HAD superfamily